jgi:hypothetical protein
MTERRLVGIDCGDREWRTAVSADGRITPFACESGDAFFFDPRGTISTLGVRFPSLVQGLGRNVPIRYQLRDESAESVVTRRLGQVRLAVNATEVVLAVPIGLTSNRRTALLDCARSAGWEQVSLIDRCTAAALVHHGGRESPMTTLVLDLGYGDCEYALVRQAKGHRGVMASGVVSGLSGEMLDAVIMEATVLALRKKGMFLGLPNWTDREWLEYRQFAEQARFQLHDQAEADTPMPAVLTRLPRPLMVRLSRARFAQRIEPLMTRMITAIRDSLAEQELELSDLDAFLVIGSTGRVTPILEMTAHSFEGKPCRTDQDLVAAGAVWQACLLHGGTTGLDSRLWSETPPATESSGFIPSGTGDGTEAECVEVLDGPTVSSPPTTEPPETVVASAAAVRALMEEGRYLEAETMVESMSEEVETLRAEIARHLNSPGRRILARARAALRAGQIDLAVTLSHQAHDQDLSDPEVFDGMMKIHVDAGTSLSRPEDYTESIKIMLCAYQHSQSDRSIHKAIAERHYRHAVAMHGLNNITKALAAVKQALHYDRKHVEADRLLKQLTS